MKTEAQAVMVPSIRVRNLSIVLVGDSPLISHRWSEKAKKQMLDKQMKKAKTAKEAKDPFRDFVESLYWLNKNGESMEPAASIKTQEDVEAHKPGWGFPCVAFKGSAVGACRFSDGVKMTEARGAFHVTGEYVRIDGTPSMREDMVRVGMGTADLRYRGEFKAWRATLSIAFNSDAFSEEQIVNLFNLGGFGVGVGEWRPEKDGSYGRFHVASEKEV